MPNPPTTIERLQEVFAALPEGVDITCIEFHLTNGSKWLSYSYDVESHLWRLVQCLPGYGRHTYHVAPSDLPAKLAELGVGDG